MPLEAEDFELEWDREADLINVKRGEGEERNWFHVTPKETTGTTEVRVKIRDYDGAEYTITVTVIITNTKAALKLDDGTESTKARVVFDLNEENADRVLGRWYEVVTESEDWKFEWEEADLVNVKRGEGEDRNWFHVTPREKTGATDILVRIKNSDGSESILTVTAVVINSKETVKPDEDVNGGAAEVDIAVSEEAKKIPPAPDGLSEADAAELEERSQTAIDDAIRDIVEIAQGAALDTTAGFDKPDNLQKYIDEGLILPGVETVIYPKQMLTGVSTSYEKSIIKDEAGNDKEVYNPVISKVEFDIKPYAKAKGTSEEGTELPGLNGRFTFRIPIPSGISSAANYAQVDHEGEDLGYKPIANKGTRNQYIEVTTRHFSKFTLTFAENDPTATNQRYSGGSSDGGSSTTSTSGTWILDAVGWWYRNADNSYPYGTWAYLYYSTNNYKWYHFNVQGYMETGWFMDVDGHRYYLHPVSDGTQGYMYTGWHQIDGNWYYFTETKTDSNPIGSLLVNTTTPDGYSVNAAGIWVK